MTIEERDLELGRLIREHSDRRRDYAALTAKLNRIGWILHRIEIYEKGAEAAKQEIREIAPELELSPLLRLIDEHAQLAHQIQADLNILRAYGVER